MESPASPADNFETWSDTLVRSLGVSRQRFDGFVQGQNQRLSKLECELAARLAELEKRAAVDRDFLTRERSRLEVQATTLAEQENNQAQSRAQLATQAAQLESLRTEITQRGQQLDARLVELEAATSGMAQREERLNASLAALDSDRQRMRARRAKIIAYLRRRRAEHRQADHSGEAQRAQAGELQTRLEHELADAREQCGALDGRASAAEGALAARQAELDSFGQRLAELERNRDSLAHELSLERQRAAQLEEARSAAARSAADFESHLGHSRQELERASATIHSLRGELDEIRHRSLGEGEAARQIEEDLRQTRLNTEEAAARLEESSARSRTLENDLTRASQELEQARSELAQTHARLEQAVGLQEEYRATCEEAQAACRGVAEELAAVKLQRDEFQRRGLSTADSDDGLARMDEVSQRSHAEAASLRSQLEAAAVLLSEAESAQNARQQRLEELEAERNDRQRRLEELEAERKSLEECLAEAADRISSGHDQQLAELTAEREGLAAEVADLRAELEQASAGGGGEGMADAARLYELAMEDIRELKKRNAELERKVSQSPPAPAAGQQMDWEAQKRRLLAALEADESDGADDSEELKRDRLKMQEVIRATSEAVEAKNRELAELKEVLEQQSSSIGSMAVGAAALGELLGQDEIIQQERERLTAMQQEWSDKLRQGEVDLSLERAKVARERAEVDERQRALEVSLAKARANAPPTSDSSKVKRPPRERWLSRLGLKDRGKSDGE